MRATWVNLKCCLPKGMPTIVMQKRRPIIRWATASSTPEIQIQRMFKSKDMAPPLFATFLPKGNMATPAILKHWIPSGMPMIVMHQRIPAIIQPSPRRKPPNKNQIRFPIKLISFAPDYILTRYRPEGQ